MCIRDSQAAAERKAESLKRYVADALAGEKFQTERVSVTWRKSEAAEFTGNIALLPPSCIRVKPEVNLAELKQRLKGGAIIPGARLVVRNNIQIKQVALWQRKRTYSRRSTPSWKMWA